MRSRNLIESIYRFFDFFSLSNKLSVEKNLCAFGCLMRKQKKTHTYTLKILIYSFRSMNSITNLKCHCATLATVRLARTCFYSRAHRIYEKTIINFFPFCSWISLRSFQSHSANGISHSLWSHENTFEKKKRRQQKPGTAKWPFLWNEYYEFRC